ncbi:MAG TPA: hypothetical protein VK619_15575 [Pyrinomonadaceae bacterium]|nr:hypothetical protein [Pyrinomonadaceae bacterium]
MTDARTPMAVAVTTFGISIFDFFAKTGRELRTYKLSQTQYVDDSSTNGELASDPVAVASGNRLHVVGAARSFYGYVVPLEGIRHYDNGNWEDLPNPGWGFRDAPTICSVGDERLDVFVIGKDKQLWHSYRDKNVRGWAPWINDAPRFDRPGGLISAPAAVSWGSTRIDIVAMDINKELWHVCYDHSAGGWMGWHPIGGTGTSAPTICSMWPGRLDIFIRGQDDTIYQKTWDNGWRDWDNYINAPPYGGASSGPVAVAVPPNLIYVFARGKNSTAAVWHIQWDGKKWGKWLPTIVKGR